MARVSLGKRAKHPRVHDKSQSKVQATSEADRQCGKQVSNDLYGMRLDAYRVGAHGAAEEEDVRLGPA